MEKHEFLDLLEALGATLSCQVCSSREWSLLVEPVADLANQQLAVHTVAQVKKADDSKRPIGVPAFVMICDTCGFMRLHSAEKLRFLGLAMNRIRERGAADLADRK